MDTPDIDAKPDIRFLLFALQMQMQMQRHRILHALVHSKHVAADGQLENDRAAHRNSSSSVRSTIRFLRRLPEGFNGFLPHM